MDESVSKSTLKNDDLENLPLFFKTIFYNDLTNIEDELKLFKYNSRIQTNGMRHYDANRVICKTFDIQLLKNDDDI